MIEPPATASTTLFKGGPTLIDLLVDVTELRITVTGPRMLFERLELVTTLSAFDGCTVQRLQELAGCLEGTIHCGLVGVQHAHIQVETLRSGGSLQVDLGPPSMYQSELVLRTRTGETFRALVQRLLASDPTRPFVAGLHAVTASGHLEHGHSGTPGTVGTTMPRTLEEPSMDVRKSAVDLSSVERDRFLEALIRLKHRPVPNGPAGVSVYDQFVALHGAVFAVLAPGLPPGDTVNFGHWNIGFCAWHRKYLREFEKALQAEVAGVSLPYWDWSDHVGAVGKLFVAEFLGALGAGAPAPLAGGVLRNPVPPAERPAWWPAGAEGFPIHPLLEAEFGPALARGSVGVGWPPTVAGVQQLEQLVVQQPGVHPFWYFWLVLEQGHQQVTSRTHNRGHNFIGGHMSTGFSPNDPVFWLHHANVDRLWANWQARRLAEVPGSTPEDHYPPPAELSPLDGDPAPPGHRLDDQMWPWVGGAPGFDVEIDSAVKPLLPDLSGAPAVTVREMLDTVTVDPQGYRYAAPGQP